MATRRSVPRGRNARSHGELRSRKPREERWLEILDVAARIFAKRGYDATSLEEIAVELGILKGSLYYYINTKRDLLAHLLRDAHEKGLNNIRPIADGEGNSISRLARMIRAHVNYVCTDRDRTAVFLHERKWLTPEQRVKYLGDEHAYRRLFERVIQDGQKEGLIRSDLDAKLIALCLLSSVNSVYDWYNPAGGQSPASISDMYVLSWLSGVTTERGSAMVGGLQSDAGFGEYRKAARKSGSKHTAT